MEGVVQVGALSRTRRVAWIVVTCLLVTAGIIGSVLGARAVSRSDADKQRLAFHLTAADIASTLRLAIQHEEDLVINASAFVTGTSHMTAKRFDIWAESVRAMRRYPELENIGLIKRVPAARLRPFIAHLERHPVRALGADTSNPPQSFTIIPGGSRPYYCLAVAGLSRSLATYLPAGLDYCALANTLERVRTTGQSSYAPFADGETPTLGVQTPVYRGGVIPPTVAARSRLFVGWLAERLRPNVLLERAREGHPHTSVTFTYNANGEHIRFSNGHAPAGAQVSTIALHNGWTVRSASALPASGALHDEHAFTLLFGGSLVSILLGLLVYMLGTGRRRALALVEQKTRELSHLAMHDNLTGLPNRALVLDRAKQILARATRQDGIVAGALFVDVDGFKYVNDKFGHAAGDRLLCVVSERLLEAVRDQDTVGRLGGDEFVVLVEASAKESSADVLANRLVEALREPVELEQGHVNVTASIGVAMGHYATPDALLRDADLALYAAKAAGKDRYTLFDAAMSADIEDRITLEPDLARAVEDKQLFLLYQPIFDLPSGEITAVEALVRWRHPVRGIISPDQFIPLAEEAGLIVAIGDWVLREACRQAREWSSQGHQVDISVNVSAHQLGHTQFTEGVKSTLQEMGLEPRSLMLEITETALMCDVASASEHLHQLEALGVQIAIDDFGTGYAALSQLQSLPVDILKIDSSFIAALENGFQSRDLLQAILGVGSSLSLRVIAEGIETDRQLRLLRSMGCEMGQGFLLARPEPAEVIAGLLGTRPDDAGVASSAL